MLVSSKEFAEWHFSREHVVRNFCVNLDKNMLKYIKWCISLKTPKFVEII